MSQDLTPAYLGRVTPYSALDWEDLWIAWSHSPRWQWAIQEGTKAGWSPRTIGEVLAGLAAMDDAAV